MSSTKLTKSISSSEDDGNRYAMITDEKKRKRMISNRESARRSRMKREQHIKDLNDQVTYFMTKSGETVQKIKEITRRYTDVESENRILRIEGENLIKRLGLMERMLDSCNNSNNNNNSSYECGTILDDDIDKYFVKDILQDPWMQPSNMEHQSVDGIYQF